MGYIKTIYIIGEMGDIFSCRCQSKFKNAQKYLEEIGFKVINPIETYGNGSVKFRDAFRMNITFLLECDAVYILPCMLIGKGNNIELRLALQMNMFLIHGAYYDKEIVVENDLDNYFLM